MQFESSSSKPERVFVFIDGSNLYKGTQACLHSDSTALRPPAVNFPPDAIHKLSEYLCGPRQLVKINYYNSPLNRNDPGYKGQQKFFDDLKKRRYLEIRYGHLKKRTINIYCQTCSDLFNEAVCIKCKKRLPLMKYTDKGTDVNIATDLLVSAFDNHYDTAILISEDGDFAGAIQEVRRLKKKVENVFFRKRYLAQVSNAFIPLTAQLLKSFGVS